jgi:hypothetical protein
MPDAYVWPLVQYIGEGVLVGVVVHGVGPVGPLSVAEGHSTPFFPRRRPEM